MDVCSFRSEKQINRHNSRFLINYIVSSISVLYERINFWIFRVRRNPKIRRQNGRQHRAADERRGRGGRDGDQEQQPPGESRLESCGSVDGWPFGGNRRRAVAALGRHGRLADWLPGGRRGGARVAGAGRGPAAGPVGVARRRPSVNPFPTTTTDQFYVFRGLSVTVPNTSVYLTTATATTDL